MSCCGHKFCRECIERVEKDEKDCPLCSTPKFSYMGEHSLDRTLKDLEVFCSLNIEGCEWMGKLRDLENHLNRSHSIENWLSGCQFVEVECMYHQCGESLQRRHIPHHINQCKKRPYSCEYCHECTSTFEDVTENHYKICSKYPVACPNDCSVYKFERQAVERHVENECPLVVVNCPFTYTGCGVTLPRRDMHEHAQDVSTHFILLGSFTQKLARENKELRSHIVQMEVEAEKKQKALLDNITKLSSVCRASKHYIQHSEMLGREVSSECMAMVSRSVISDVVEMELRSMYFSLLPYEFRMEKFLSYKKGPVEYSPVFYTHSLGYKFRVKVFRTQYSKMLSLDAFTSIYVEIMPGPFDETLKWPFKGSVTIQIVNQLNDCNHYEKTLRFCDRTYQTNKIRPDDSANITWGFKSFIYHKELRSENCKAGQKIHYLQDGSLLIHITRINLS